MPNFIGPDGKVYDLKDEATAPDALSKLTAAGFRLESESPQTLGEKITTTVAEPLQAFGQGALSGMTAGLSDAARFKAPAGDPELVAMEAAREEKRKRISEESPIAHGIGEVAGMLASPVGKVGEGLEAAVAAKTVGQKIATSALRGAAEGSLFGAGNAVSEAALGDTELTAEKLMAGAGLGGMLGMAGGGLGHALMEGGSAIAGKAAKAIGDIDLGEFAASKALNAAGATQKDLDRLGAEKVQAAGKMMLERGHLGTGLEAPNANGILESVTKDKEGVGKKLGDLLEHFDTEGGRGGGDYAATAKKLDQFEAGLSPYQRDEISTELAKARRIVAELDESGAGLGSLNTLKQDLQRKAKWSQTDNATQGMLGDLKRKLSGVIREDFDNQVTGRFGDAAGKELRETNALWGQLADAERIAEHGAERLGGNASYGLRDIGMGAAGFLKGVTPLASIATGLVSAIASKTVRERGAGIIARLANQFTESPALSAIATSFAKKAVNAPQLGKYASRLAEAAAISPQHALATHMVLAQADPQYQLHANMAGFVPEDAAEHTGALMRGAGIARLAAGVAAHDDDMERHLESIFKGEKAPPAVGGGKDFGAKRMRKSTADGHDERVDEIIKVASDPQALLDRVSRNMGDLPNVAPGVAAALTQKAQAAAQYLAGEVKRPLKAGPLAAEWKPTETEKQSFARKYHAVVDPMSVLKHAAAGTLTSDEMKALQAVYPRLARLAADQLLSKMAGHDKPVPYKARLMLSMVSGISADGSTSGVSIARNQAAINAPSRKQDAQGLGGNGKSHGEFKVANRMATPGQRREMQEE